ncbi:sensor domain-containing diguanylate cyclase [Tuberibacillus sp. Marseille-P3662]|uniref:sensor domain-containing diguanylate cyclase n=1 Tax=Tuberibacillus sp. Marseille-P3662 TaxID=1965358 RepID=UPI0015934F22|nr:sensor domain-containing diguanylate cyclase [Tuberibacillus sp. Marseille-P3662]
MSERQTNLLWMIWAVIGPLSFIVVYITNPPVMNGSFLAIMTMAGLLIVSALSYFRVRGTDIIVLQGISIAVFLIFGLFVEMALTQISILIYMLSKRLSREQHYKFPINSLMFLFVSIVSALIYFWLGGDIGMTQNSRTLDFIPILGYVLASFGSNQLFLYGLRWFLIKDRRFFGKDLFWELITIILMMPVGIILYILFFDMGIYGILIIAIPVMTLSIIFRMMNRSYEVNQLLQRSNQIGQQLTEKLEVNQITNLFFQSITKILRVDYLYIIDIDDQGKFSLVQLYEKSPNAVKGGQIKSSSGISWKVGYTGGSYRADKRKQWRHLSKGFLPRTAESVLSVPMRRNNEVVGVITAASESKYVYEKHHLMVLEIMANFLGVAIENARNYEKTKQESERCPLTNLYNYRYFANLLEGHFRNLTADEPFSIIMIDLDFFKRINDTYGHETGNQVLREVAKRLMQIVGQGGTVARYGGEEFVVYLPNAEWGDAFEMAEDIRYRISEEPFLTVSSLEYEEKEWIHLTASIGISTAPEQGEDSVTLIRNADRAMYSGAKKKGRNRVATYTG